MISYFVDNLDLWTEGFVNTVSLTTLSFIIGFFVAVPIGLARTKPDTILSKIAYVYIYVMRGTPLLVQIFIIYYGLGQFSNELRAVGMWWLFKDAFYCCLLVFTLNTAAYQAEIVRGAVSAIPKGLGEAGMAIGMTPFKVFRFIKLPVAIAKMMPAMGNELVLLLKASSLASVITVNDVMGQTRFLYSQTLDLNVYYIAALNYLLVVLIIEAIWRKMEGRALWLNPRGT